MNHFFVEIFFLLIIAFLIVLIYFRQTMCKKNIILLINYFSKNIDLLTIFLRRQEVIQIKNTIGLCSQLQVILKISNADFISLFKYDFSTRYILLDFLISIDGKGSIIQDSILDNLPVTSSLLTLNILDSDDKDLYTINSSEMKKRDEKLFQLMQYRGINKIYYQNIFKNKEIPLGFIGISYNDENSNLSEGDKFEIMRTLDRLKSFL